MKEYSPIVGLENMGAVSSQRRRAPVAEIVVVALVAALVVALVVLAVRGTVLLVRKILRGRA